MLGTLLVTGLAPPAWRAGAGPAHRVAAGRVVAGTAVATGGSPPPRGTGDGAGPATVTSLTLTEPGADTVTVLTGRPGQISQSVQAARQEDTPGLNFTSSLLGKILNCHPPAFLFFSGFAMKNICYDFKIKDKNVN